MVFSTTTLFKGIACPQGDRCALTNCIYSHDDKPSAPASVVQSVTAKAEHTTQQTNESVEPAAKRRKITYENLSEKPPSRADLIRDQLAASRAKPTPVQRDTGHAPKTGARSQAPLSTLVKAVSPPPTRANNGVQTDAGSGVVATANDKSHQAAPSSATGKVETRESLNPRLIANDPAGHQKRLLFLKHLHAEMTRLNRQVSETVGLECKDMLFLSEQSLIKLALDEEERYAREQPKLYSNFLKQRLVALKKMQVDEWVKHVKATLKIESPKSAKKAEKVIDTALPLQQEHLILPHLVVDQKPLAGYGYIPTPPSAEQATEAAAAVEASRNYEECDRCTSRFRMFPDRDDQGRLASNGPCFFHPYRKVFPPRSKSDKETGPKEPYYPCCNETVGAPGCTRHEDHVFKTSSPARLAAIMSFIDTPNNSSPSKDRSGREVEAVTFDCEMGYTTLGMELIRLTAVSWPSGDPLLDILVRPLGTVIDLNSRFSGVFHESFKDAIPYDTWEKQQQGESTKPPPSEPGVLPVVDRPQRARELLCSFIKPTTPLIGHAIDNDLNIVRLCHPTIIDTIVLYPHPRGLPMRFGLKMLTQKHLHRYIQTGGDRGHDSLEDAVATGDLVRLKVGEKWKLLRSAGWKIEGDQLVSPAPTGQEEPDILNGEEQLLGRKRKKRPSSDSSGDESKPDVAANDAGVVNSA